MLQVAAALPPEVESGHEDRRCKSTLETNQVGRKCEGGKPAIRW
jgi:hypothetical protein